MYENVIAMIVSETIALKQTTGAKLMRDKMQVDTTSIHTARRDTSNRILDSILEKYKHRCASDIQTGASKYD